MKDRRQELMSRILMAAAPLLMLLAVSIAWFVSSRTVSLSELSFASADTGPGAALHRAVGLEHRAWDAAAQTLAYDVAWGPEETVEKSDITIRDMLPGQCEYYLLLSDKDFTPVFSNLVLTDSQGAELAAGDPTAAERAQSTPLLQCLGFYLLPLSQEEIDKFDWDKAGQADGPATAGAKIALTRAADGRLNAAVLQNGPTDAALPKPETPGKGYILVLYCDSAYGQGSKDAPRQVGSLPGSVSFSLRFDTKTAEGA